ncbi:MAG: DNA-binding protein [Acidimicrobiales bacterium]
MALKKVLHRLTAPMSEFDEEKLREFCAGRECLAISDAEPRREVTLVGEITSLRIVPRAGSPSLEATISDGSGALVAVWTGRRRIAGVAPGRRLMIGGRGAPIGYRGRLLFYNPRYELL